MNFLKKIKPMSQQVEGRVESYFEEAKSWAYERYQIQEVMANRWQLAFWVSMGFCLLLTILLIILLPLKSWEPIVIQRNLQTGETWVELAQTHYLPETSNEIESDLVRYVIARETFSFVDDGMRFKQVEYMSAPAVAKVYENNRASANPQSPFNIYGAKGLRKIKIEDIVFLDNENNNVKREKIKMPTLAKIDFVTTETHGDATIQSNWVATIRFKYLGTPNSKEAAWLNWNGFTVTDYRVDQKNI